MFWPGWAAWPARSTKLTTAPNCPPPDSKPWTSSPPAYIGPPMHGNPWRVWGSTWTPSRPWGTGSSSAALSAPASRRPRLAPAADSLRRMASKWGLVGQTPGPRPTPRRPAGTLQGADPVVPAAGRGRPGPEGTPTKGSAHHSQSSRIVGELAAPSAIVPLRDRPALAHGGHEVLVSLHVVGDLHLRRIVFQLAFHPKGDHAEQHPLHERCRHVEVGTGRVASLAGADPIPVVARRPRQ